MRRIQFSDYFHVTFWPFHILTFLLFLNRFQICHWARFLLMFHWLNAIEFIITTHQFDTNLIQCFTSEKIAIITYYYGNIYCYCQWCKITFFAIMEGKTCDFRLHYILCLWACLSRASILIRDVMQPYYNTNMLPQNYHGKYFIFKSCG